MRFEVPQFIEIEDKIFGPFTWRQFVYLLGGVGFALVLFIAAPLFIFILLGIPTAGVAVLLAFYPVNNRPFSIFLESVFTFYQSGNTYFWRKEQATVYKGSAETVVEATNHPTPIATPAPSARGINNLSRQLELKAIQKPQS